jgi:hypothetical protein
MAEYKLALPEMPEDVKPRIAHLLARMGKRSEVLRMVDAMEHPKPDEPPPDAHDVAVVYAALGERDAAFQWLSRAYDQRSVAALKVDPKTNCLREENRVLLEHSANGACGSTTTSAVG